MIKVLVVDDSPVAREFLTHVINSAPDMHVVGTARDGVEAVDAVTRWNPDIVTMDIIMPRMDGTQAIERIMQTAPRPIVVVTGNTITEEVRATFQSLDSGALALVPRPNALTSDRGQADAENLVSTLRLMSEIRVVRRIPRRSPQRPAVFPRAEAAGGKSQTSRLFRVVAMGASTGGPSALKTIIGALPRTFPVPILVVQHIAPGFVDGFVSWLAENTAVSVGIATHGEPLAPGRVYVAPDGLHLGVGREACVELVASAAIRQPGGLCPSVSHLFESVERVYGSQALAVLLTGMGRDGADGLLKLKGAGAITVAQDKESSVVHGMPAEAIALGAAEWVLPPARIADLLTTFAAEVYPNSE